MILFTARKIFQSQTVLDRDHNAAGRRFPKVCGNAAELLAERVLRLDITASVLEYADQKDIVIIAGKVRFDIFEITDHDLYVPAVFVAVRVDHGAFP